MQNDNRSASSSDAIRYLLNEGQFVAVKLRRGPQSVGDHAIAGKVKSIDRYGFRVNVFAYLANSGPLESCMDLIVPWDNVDWIWADTDDEDLDLFITEVASELSEEARQSLTSAGILK